VVQYVMALDDKTKRRENRRSFKEFRK